MKADVVLLAELRPVLRDLVRLRTGRTLAAIGVTWGIIAAAVGATLWWPTPAVWVVAAFVVATRQHALMVLAHEATHGLVARDRFVNDLVGDALCAWPLGFTIAEHRVVHLAHHRHLETARDPDYTARRDHPDWQFPRSRRQLAGILVRLGLGGGLIVGLHHLRLQRRVDAGLPGAPPWRRALRWGLVLGAVAGMVALGLGWHALGLWLAPMLFLLPPLLRIRTMGEHYGLPMDTVLTASRDYRAHPLIEAAFVPYQIHLHLSHHLCPAVPYYHLPALSAQIARHPRASGARFNRGLFCGPDSVWADLSRGAR